MKPAAPVWLNGFMQKKQILSLSAVWQRKKTISRTAEQLLWYNDSLHIIVNLAACHGYAPESTIQAVYKMRKSGISVVSNAEEIPEQMLRYANEAWFKVS